MFLFSTYFSLYLSFILASFSFPFSLRTSDFIFCFFSCNHFIVSCSYFSSNSFPNFFFYFAINLLISTSSTVFYNLTSSLSKHGETQRPKERKNNTKLLNISIHNHLFFYLANNFLISTSPTIIPTSLRFLSLHLTDTERHCDPKKEKIKRNYSAFLSIVISVSTLRTDFSFLLRLQPFTTLLLLFPSLHGYDKTHHFTSFLFYKVVNICTSNPPKKRR